jgi:hypothetical protein
MFFKHMSMTILASVGDFEFLELTDDGDYVHVYTDDHGGWCSDPVFLDPAGRTPQVYAPRRRSAQEFS